MTQPRPSQATRGVLIAVLVIGVLLVAIVGTLGIRGALSTPTPTPTSAQGVISLDPPRDLDDFTLPSSSGQPLSLSDLRGKYTLLFFGYTHCPDYCPLTLAEWKTVKDQLGDLGDQVNFLFISVDGERDTPDVMARYLSRFDPSFIGMTGDEATLTRIGPPYGLYYLLHKEEGENYSVDHTTQTYLLNPQMQMIDVFSYGIDPDVEIQTIRDAITSAS